MLRAPRRHVMGTWTIPAIPRAGLPFLGEFPPALQPVLPVLSVLLLLSTMSPPYALLPGVIEPARVTALLLYFSRVLSLLGLMMPTMPLMHSSPCDE